MNINKINYRLGFADGSEKQLELQLRSDSLAPVGWVPNKPPQWTALSYNQCKNCPLNPEKVTYCPAALSLAKLVEQCHELDPLDSTTLKVTAARRVTAQTTTVQKAIGSFIGLLMATSDCPHAAFFRPLARFHQPLASESETMYRAVSAYLLAQYFRHESGQEAKLDAQGMVDIYQNLEIVNTALAGRLKASGETGVVVQCMTEWGVFSGMFPMRLDELLQELRPLFSAYLPD